jgi:hypothetical protein
LQQQQKQQQQQQQPEPIQQQQQAKTFRRQRQAAAATSHIQVPGLPITLPRSLLPSMTTAQESFWARFLFAAFGMVAAGSTIVGLMRGGDSKQQQAQQGQELGMRSELAVAAEDGSRYVLL